MEDQRIDEKIKWYNLLLALGIVYNSVMNYKEYSYLQSIYTAINSPQSIPNADDQKRMNEIRIGIIDEIEKSNLFNRFDKKFVIDSIKNIDFRIVDDLNFSPSYSKGSETVACYINLEKY